MCAECTEACWDAFGQVRQCCLTFRDESGRLIVSMNTKWLPRGQETTRLGSLVQHSKWLQ